MGIVFKGKHPTFGRGKRSSISGTQTESHYFYWWEFLRRNEEYAACCASEGQGDLAQLYADFGVVSNDNFKDWWFKNGYRLFAEQSKPIKLRELNDPGEWDTSWDQEQVMVVVVPLDIPKRNLQGFFAKLLKKRHGGERGQKSLSKLDKSTSKYKIFQHVRVETLKNHLRVYDAVMANKLSESPKTLAKIGAELKLVEDAMPSSKDTAIEAAAKRNVMASTVSRYFREAQNIVANTAKGQFPNTGRKLSKTSKKTKLKQVEQPAEAFHLTLLYNR